MHGYTEQTGYFESYDRSRLFYRSFLPEEAHDRTPIVIQHGSGEHSGRYTSFIEAFAGSGRAIYLYDMRGHGLSPGKRGYADGIAQLSHDLDSFLTFLSGTFSVKRPLLLGFSMGGVVALHETLHGGEEKLAGLILISPALLIEKTVSIRMKKFFGTLAMRLLPHFTLSNGITAKKLSHDRGVVKATGEDRYMHDRIGIRLGLDLLLQGDELRARAGELSLPLYIAHGLDDVITSPQGSREFYRNSASSIKELKLYEGYFHELFNERPDLAEKVFEDLIRWVDSV